MDLRVTSIIGSIVICISMSSNALAQADTNDNISNYLVDVGATPVTAGGIIGLSGSAITNIQSSQELAVAINPLTSGSTKSGFGLSITPARTNITPLSGKLYMQNSMWRLLGAATISYAENTSTITGVSYKKTAVSLDTTYYLNKVDDPVISNYIAFTTTCHEERQKHIDKALIAKNTGDDKTFKIEMDESVKAHNDCIDNAAKNAKWNASKLSLSFGSGWITPDAGGAKQSLGKTLAIGGVYELGKDSAAYFTLRHTMGEVNLQTLASTPIFKNSNIAAIRFTQGSASDSTLRWLMELSNANSSSATVSNDVFKYAFGMDKKLYSGLWLEFRVGKKRSADGTSSQTASLLNLNWAAASTLFGNKQ